MTNVIFVDFARHAVVPAASMQPCEVAVPARLAAAANAMIPLPPPPPDLPASAMPATASLAQVIVQLRAGARDAEAALAQMRAGSAELIRLSADMRQHTGELAGQIGIVATALHDFGSAVRKMHDGGSAATVH